MSDPSPILNEATFEEIADELARRYPASVIGASFLEGTTGRNDWPWDFDIRGCRVRCSGLLREMDRDLTAVALSERMEKHGD